MDNIANYVFAEGEPVPFELVSQVMKNFGQVFKESSTRQQRKQLLNLFVSKVTIDKSRAIDTIELDYEEKDDFGNNIKRVIF